MQSGAIILVVVKRQLFIYLFGSYNAMPCHAMHIEINKIMITPVK